MLPSRRRGVPLPQECAGNNKPLGSAQHTDTVFPFISLFEKFIIIALNPQHFDITALLESAKTIRSDFDARCVVFIDPI